MASPGLPSRGNNRNGGSIPGGGGSSFIRASASRVTPSTSSYLSGDDDDDDAQTLPREPMRRMNWTPPGDTSSSENRGENRTRTPAPLDEWDYAERGPLARLKTRQLTEVAREKAGMGVYVDDAELGAFADDTPGHLKKLASDPDFFGPESYPRRQRDWVGYYVAFVFIFASFVIGTNAISSGNPGYLFGLVESSTGKLCGFEAGVTEKPYLWHPHAGEKGIGGGGELSVCVTECPLARTWVCVDETVANIFADDKTDSETEQGATQVTYNASKHNTPPPGPPPAPPTSDCPSGAYVHSLIDFEPVFMSCLPKNEDEQTISSEEDGDGGGGEATPNTPRDMHFVSALKEVDTPERFIANAVFAEIDSSRWVLLVTMLLVIGLTFGLNAILNRDARQYHSVALGGSIVLAGVCAALFGLEEWLGVDTLHGVMVDELDDRLKIVKDLRTVSPFLFVPFLFIVLRVTQHAVRNKDQLGLGTTLLDVAGGVLSLAGFDVVVPVITIGPLLAVMLWITVGTVYLSAVAAKFFHDDRVERGGGVQKFATGNATDGTGYDAGNDYTEHAGWHGVYRGATVFHVFVCAWFATWVVLFVRCVVSSAVCAWYWARDGERETKLSEMSTWRAVRRTAMCHAGSLALLAFWMPVFFIPRLIVGFVCYFGGRTDKQTPPYSQVLAYRSAAVCQIALHGVSLKRACFNQHHLKMRNGLIVKKCASASDGAMFAGWTCCALASFASASAMSSVDFLTVRAVRWTIAPATCAAAAGTVVFFAFFMAHREAVETIIQCFCEDTERNNGTPLRQYYAPASLKRLIFHDVQGQRAPGATDADDEFELEFRTQKKQKRDRRRERRSQMGSVLEEE